MKKLLLIIVLFISACHKVSDPKLQRAENLIKRYMNNPITGTPGHQKVIFSAMLSIRQNYLETKEGMAFSIRFNLERDSIKKLDSVVESLSKSSAANQAKIKSLRNVDMHLQKKLIGDIKKSAPLMLKFKGPIKGYKMFYTYKVGVKDNPSYFIYHTTTFHFDPTISKIMNAKDTVIDASDVDWHSDIDW